MLPCLFSSNTSRENYPLTDRHFHSTNSKTFLLQEDIQMFTRIMCNQILNHDILMFKTRIPTKILNNSVNLTNSFRIKVFNKIQDNNILLCPLNIHHHKILSHKLITIQYHHLKYIKTLWFGNLQLQRKEANQKKLKKRAVLWTEIVILTKTS